MSITKAAFITLSLAMSSLNSYSQNLSTSPKKAKFSIEIDPATFGFGGYGFHLRYQPKTCDHLLIGAGIYAMDLPDLIVNLNANNKDEGWNSRINLGYGLFAEHHFTEVNKGWFVGAQTSLQEYKLKREEISGETKYTNLLLMAHAGYSWKPFGDHFYIKPWAGIGYTTQISGENTLGTEEYDIAPIAMFATLHIGYTF